MVDRTKSGGAVENGPARDQRAANMLRFAADLRATGEIRADLTETEVADVIWTMNAAEYFDLFTQRGWTSQRIGRWLTDAWERLLLN